MKCTMSMILLLISALYSESEVIKIRGDFSDWTIKYFWPSRSNGGMWIDTKNIYIPDQKKLYIQSRYDNNENTSMELQLHGDNFFKICRVLVSETSFYFTILKGDGRNYLYKRGRTNALTIGPISKHGNCKRMLELPDGNIVASGNYRPLYTEYLDLYDDETAGGPTELSIQKFNEFYEKTKAFTLTFYDKNLKLLDSANIINRSGKNGRLFDMLYTYHPIDISDNGSIYLIDNEQGYVVEKYEPPYKLASNIEINNKAFKKVADFLTDERRESYDKTAGTLTQAYALYIKGDLIITSFMFSPTGRDLPEPPYFYDIMDLQGKIVSSGQFEYPLICEDQGEKVFFFSRQERGWFEDDDLFLVGMTLQDIIEGRASKQAIDSAIRHYLEAQ
ncbi:hypothetical protein HQ531_14280 [bacterium]|nr:hypothetical protein [bacterium]